VGREVADGPGLAATAGTVWGTLSTTLVPVGGTNRRQVALPEIGASPDDERLSPITDLVAAAGALWATTPVAVLRLDPGRF
jgi:hypothetical protein